MRKNDKIVPLKVKPNIYMILKKLNCMNCIHGNKVNKISEQDLLYDIINPLKLAKTFNRHYSSILQ